MVKKENTEYVKFGVRDFWWDEEANVLVLKWWHKVINFICRKAIFREPRSLIKIDAKKII